VNHALMHFIHDIGVPKDLLTDRAPEEMRGEWGQIVKKYKICQRITEASSPWQNHAEAEIRELKKLTRRALRHNSTPGEYWCYAIKWAARIQSLTAHDIMVLGSRTPEERIKDKTPDTSEFAYFSWSQWVWYKEPTSFPESDVRLGKWLGITDDVDQAMTYWVLTSKGIVIARFSVAPLSELDLQNPTVKDQFDEFTKTYHASSNAPSTSPMEIFPEIEDDLAEYDTSEADSFTPKSYDEYLLAQMVLPVGGELRKGQVTQRLQDHNGNPIGLLNSNPIMDTWEYEVSFPDGSINSYPANTIAENIYSHVDQEGHNCTLLSEIIDHEEDLNETRGELPRRTT
jgi:hypothetical protein